MEASQMTFLTDAELALWLDPERRMPGWWLEGWCYNSAGETECMGDTYHGPAFSADDIAAFTHLRGPLLAMGCEIADRPTGRTGLPYTLVLYQQCQAGNARTYAAALHHAFSRLAATQPELLREAMARVEEGA